MQLIMATDYAIRSIIYLTKIDRMATAGEISENTRVPKQYLITMSRKLKEAGIINAVPGINGGYLLGRPPEQITLLDIMRVTENTTKIIGCLEYDNCYAAKSCPFKAVCEKLQLMNDSYFGNITIKSLAEFVPAQ